MDSDTNDDTAAEDDFSSSNDDFAMKMREDGVRMNHSLKSLFDDDSVTSKSSSIYSIRSDNSSIGNNVWKPPEKHGLDNSRPIIQRWHMEKGGAIDYVEILKDDIRNLRRRN